MTYYYGFPLSRVMRQRMMEHMMGHEWPERDYSFPIDVKAETEGYDVTALLPGLSADEVDIQIDNDSVTIQGEFKAARDEKSDYIFSEIPEGKFYRSISLPVMLDASKSTAVMKDGVLTLHIPKAEEAKPKTVKVVAK
jgi:HSP20 family protein